MNNETMNEALAKWYRTRSDKKCVAKGSAVFWPNSSGHAVRQSKGFHEDLYLMSLITDAMNEDEATAYSRICAELCGSRITDRLEIPIAFNLLTMPAAERAAAACRALGLEKVEGEVGVK